MKAVILYMVSLIVLSSPCLSKEYTPRVSFWAGLDFAGGNTFIGKHKFTNSGDIGVGMVKGKNLYTAGWHYMEGYYEFKDPEISLTGGKLQYGRIIYERGPFTLYPAVGIEAGQSKEGKGDWIGGPDDGHYESYEKRIAILVPLSMTAQVRLIRWVALYVEAELYTGSYTGWLINAGVRLGYFPRARE